MYFVNDYCVIENLDKLNFESFDKYSRTALSCFGLLSGYVPRDEGFYFSYTDNKFENMEEYAYYGDFYCTYDMEIYKPIDTNFYYSFIQKGITDLEKNDFRKKAEDNLFLISESVFSKLCNLNVDSKEILRATELIMEGNQQTSPETKGVIYSVILEILTNYISKGKCKDLLTPINDKSKAKNLQKELHCVAKKYITFYENSPIQKKINSINSPTNMDKLLKPFEFLNILLTDTDKNIIKNRNYFLHGNDFIKGKDLPEFADNSLYINLKLLFLIYALLLKIIGHHGKIVNIVKKIYFKDKEIAKDEEFYRDIGNELSKNIFNY